MSNASMGKQRRRSAPDVKSPNATPSASRGSITVPKGGKVSPHKAKAVGRRISQHKRMAMGEDIDNDND